MGLVHGKSAVFKLDDLGGALQDISTSFRSVADLPGSTDRPRTDQIGDNAEKRAVMGLRNGGPIRLGGLWKASSVAVHGRASRVALEQHSLLNKVRAVTVRRGVGLSDTDQIGSNWRERGVVGMLSAGGSLGGLFNGSAGEIDAIFKALAAQEPAGLMSVGYGGFAIGSLVDLVKVPVANYRIGHSHENLTEVSADFEGDDQADLGVSLHDFVAETAAGTTNFASVDETASTNLGAVAHLHISAFSGFTNIVVKVQHSTDNSVFTDLLTFAAATGATKERLEVASGVTINRYVRGTITFTGAGPGSCTLQLSFARRSYTYGAAGTFRHLAGLYGRTATSSFEFGPEGGTTGKPKYSGEGRLSSLEVSLRHDDLISFSGELVVDGMVAEGSF